MSITLFKEVNYSLAKLIQTGVGVTEYITQGGVKKRTPDKTIKVFLCHWK